MVSLPTQQINVEQSPTPLTISMLIFASLDELHPIKKTRFTSTRAQQKQVNDLALQNKHINAHEKNKNSNAHKKATQYIMQN